MSPKGSRLKIFVAFVAGTAVGVVSAVQVAPQVKRTTEVTVAQGDAGTVIGDENPKQRRTGPSIGPTGISSGGEIVPPGIECAPGRNGGATDVGVTANSIEMATTVVRSGPGAAFLGEVQFAMEAVRNKVNREGGICGRQLKIRYVDDGWDPQRGAGYIRNFIKDGVFAIPVGPSSEGLNLSVKSGDIRTAKIPVVGTDGMLISQYTDPFVWPVAVATASSARIMARDAWKRGARKFSIVFDKNYKFGVEAAEAFNNEVKRLKHSSEGVEGYNKNNNCLKAYCGILAAQPSYSTDVAEFKSHVGDFSAMFLEPTTALTWMSTPDSPRPTQVPYGIGAAQPLFTRDFASGCQRACDQMQVWTSYKAPIEQYANDPIVRKFVSDLHKTKPDADEYNAFSEGGYIGMLQFVDALKRVGPYLTRVRLKAALDTMSLETGLTMQPTMTWKAGDHFANSTMQAFTIQFKGTFGGWRAGQIFKDETPELGDN